MSTIIIEDTVRIPNSVSDLDSFRRWARSEEFPQTGKISFLNGEVWVDMSPEQLFTHNHLKGEFSRVIQNLVKMNRMGRFFEDRTLLTHPGAMLSTEPDGLYISNATLKSDRIRLVKNPDGFIEIEGTPDM